MIEAAAVVLVSLVLSVPLTAYASTLSFPRSSWERVGRSRWPWVLALACIPLGIAFVATLAYFLFMRPRLLAATDTSRFAAGTRARVRLPSGVAEGQLVRQPWIFWFPVWRVSFQVVDGSTTHWTVTQLNIEPLTSGDP